MYVRTCVTLLKLRFSDFLWSFIGEEREREREKMRERKREREREREERERERSYVLQNSPALNESASDKWADMLSCFCR